MQWFRGDNPVLQIGGNWMYRLKMSVNRSFPLVYLCTNEYNDLPSCLVHMGVFPSPLSRDALMMMFPFDRGLTLSRLLGDLNETRQT